MRRYTDRHGQEHVVEITLLTRRRILDAMEIDLVKCAHEDGALRSMLDELSQDDTVWQMLSIIEGKPIETLMEAADGTTHEAASVALLGAIADFFPQGSPLKAPILRLMERIQQAKATAEEVAREILMEIVEAVPINSEPIGAVVPTNG